MNIFKAGKSETGQSVHMRNQRHSAKEARKNQANIYLFSEINKPGFTALKLSKKWFIQMWQDFAASHRTNGNKYFGGSLQHFKINSGSFSFKEKWTIPETIQVSDWASTNFNLNLFGNI